MALVIKNPLVKKLQHFFYPSLIDPDEKFKAIIDRYCQATWTVLDLGAGKGKLFAHGLKGHVAKVIGVDLDKGISENECIDEYHVNDILTMPFITNESIDCVVCRYVLEHVANIPQLVQEIERILKPGGVFIFLTPNRWHYFFLISQGSPQWFHQWLNTKRGIEEDDTFPTYYRMNSIRQIRRVLKGSRLRVREIEMVESDPRYLVFNPLMYLAGVAYERIVNGCKLLQGWRINIVGVVEKK
jgi:SAM-dependent methyltransferase